MRSHRKAAFIITLMVLGLVCSAQTPLKVKVIIDSANIRSRPELDAEILDIAPKGTVFDVIQKTGPWYEIKTGEDETGKAVCGYIHESMVELSGEIAPRPEDRVLPQPVEKPQVSPPPPARELKDVQVEVKPPDKHLSGSFLKYGFNDHWVASFGYDFGIGRYVGIGLEFQPYFKNLSEIERSVIQMDIFVNLKVGFRLWIFTLYGGGGVGPDLSYGSTTVDDQTTSQLKTRLVYHGIAGVAVNIGKIAVVFEYQPTLVSDPDIDPDHWGQFFFVGLRF